MSRRVALSSARSDDRGQGGQRSGAVATRTCMGLANRTYASPVVRPSRRTMRTSTGSRPWKNSRMSNSTALKGRPRRRTTGKTFSMAKPGPRGPAPKPGPIPPTMPGPKPIGFIIAVGSMSSVLKHARREKGTRGGIVSEARSRAALFAIREARDVLTAGEPPCEMIARAIARGGAVEIRGSSTAGRTLVRVRVRCGSGRVLSASWCARRRADEILEAAEPNSRKGTSHTDLDKKLGTSADDEWSRALPIDGFQTPIGFSSLAVAFVRSTPTGTDRRRLKRERHSQPRHALGHHGGRHDAGARSRPRASAPPPTPRRPQRRAFASVDFFSPPVSPRWRDLTSSGLAPPVPPPWFRSK